MLVLFYIAIFLFFGLCAFLSFFILIQESKSMGFGASFGGDSGTSLFGTSTADVLKKITAYLAVVFFIACLVLSYWSAGLSQTKISVPTMIESS